MYSNLVVISTIKISFYKTESKAILSFGMAVVNNGVNNGACTDKATDFRRVLLII